MNIPACANTIFERLIKGEIYMPKAKQYVDQGISSVEETVQTLQQALGHAEKQANKDKIQDAINSLHSAQQQLNGYQD